MRGPRWTMPGAVYAYWVRKPNAILGLPFLGRHCGYVGQTRNERMRDLEHKNGGGRYGRPAAAWSDLRPRRVILFRMKHCPQWLLNLVEWLAIKILMPVYNDRHNRTNPRRISRNRARFHRGLRDRSIHVPVPTVGGLIPGILALAIVIGVMAR